MRIEMLKIKDAVRTMTGKTIDLAAFLKQGWEPLVEFYIFGPVSISRLYKEGMEISVRHIRTELTVKEALELGLRSSAKRPSDLELANRLRHAYDANGIRWTDKPGPSGLLEPEPEPLSALHAAAWKWLYACHPVVAQRELAVALERGWQGQPMRHFFDTDPDVRDYVTEWDGGRLRQDECQGLLTRSLFGCACPAAHVSTDSWERAKNLLQEIKERGELVSQLRNEIYACA